MCKLEVTKCYDSTSLHCHYILIKMVKWWVRFLAEDCKNGTQCVSAWYSALKRLGVRPCDRLVSCSGLCTSSWLTLQEMGSCEPFWLARARLLYFSSPGSLSLSTQCFMALFPPQPPCHLRFSALSDRAGRRCVCDHCLLIYTQTWGVTRAIMVCTHTLTIPG